MSNKRKSASRFEPSFLKDATCYAFWNRGREVFARSCIAREQFSTELSRGPAYCVSQAVLPCSLLPLDVVSI
jgi:hypothetical protein